MARYCVVAPPKILEGLRIAGKMGSYHLLLAHDVVKQREAYHDLFSKNRLPFMSDKELIILDNSVVELGTAVNIDMITAAARLTYPTCIVLPDVMLDGPATVDSTMNAYHPWRDAALNDNLSATLMVIPQGKTMQEFADCAEKLKNLRAVQYWGCPRNLVKNLGTRKDAIRLLHALNPSRRIHMFGFSDNMIDDVICAHMPEVYSIDSAVPLRVNNFRISDIPEPRGDWWETGIYHPDVELNVAYARNIFGTSNAKV